MPLWPNHHPALPFPTRKTHAANDFILVRANISLYCIFFWGVHAETASLAAATFVTASAFASFCSVLFLPSLHLHCTFLAALPYLTSTLAPHLVPHVIFETVPSLVSSLPLLVSRYHTFRGCLALSALRCLLSSSPRWSFPSILSFRHCHMLSRS
jgi:hypothetical protein